MTERFHKRNSLILLPVIPDRISIYTILPRNKVLNLSLNFNISSGRISAAFSRMIVFHAILHIQHPKPFPLPLTSWIASEFIVSEKIGDLMMIQLSVLNILTLSMPRYLGFHSKRHSFNFLSNLMRCGPER